MSDDRAPGLFEHIRVTWIYLDKQHRDTCRGPNCRAPITFVQNCKTMNVQPITGHDVDRLVIATRMEPGTMRQQGQISLEHAHHATCPDVAAFKAGKQAKK